MGWLSFGQEALMKRWRAPIRKAGILAAMVFASSMNAGPDVTAAPPEGLRFEVVYPAHKQARERRRQPGCRAG